MTINRLKYLFVDGKTPLSAETFNAIFFDIDGRLHALETIKIVWQEAVSELQQFGLARINAVLGPVLEQAAAEVAAIAKSREAFDAERAAAFVRLDAMENTISSLGAWPKWAKDTTYAQNDTVIGGDGQNYRCLRDGVSGADPVSDDGKTWTRISVSRDDIAASQMPGLISPFSGKFGGPANKHPIDRRSGQPNMAYAICDGGTYTAPDGAQVITPDLRDRFIVGSSATKAAGSSGGAETTTSQPTTLTAAQMPQHPHIVGAVGYLDADPGGGSYRMTIVAGGGAAGFYFNQITSVAAGSSQPHTHAVTSMPPWYAMAFVMLL